MRNSEIRRQHKEKIFHGKKDFSFSFHYCFYCRRRGGGRFLSVGEQRASGYFRKYCTGCVVPHL